MHNHVQTDQELNVSPGPHSEVEFISKIVPGSGYVLPQYVTGLLLSRNVVLDFSNTDIRHAARAVRSSYSASASGGFGFWSASFSFNHGRSHSTARFEQTSTGLRVSIPGAQVIGYYTQIVPKFPYREGQ